MTSTTATPATPAGTPRPNPVTTTGIPGLDHVLVRGLMPQGPERHWPEGLRRHGDVLLSDHAPVELEVR